MNIMQCSEYAVIGSGKTVKVYLQKNNLIKSEEEVSGGIFSVQNKSFENQEEQPDLNYQICLLNLNEKTINALSQAKHIHIVFFEGTKILKTLNSKLIKII